MTWLEIIQSAKGIVQSPKLDESDLSVEVDSALTIADWVRWSNDSQLYHMNMVVLAAQDYFGALKTVSYTADKQEYDIPGDSVRVRLIERTDTDPDKIIRPILINDRLLHTPRYNVESVYYSKEYNYLWGNVMGIVPTPEGSGTLNYLYIRRLPDLNYGTAASATSSAIVLAATPSLGATSNEDDYYKNATVRIISATNGAGQRKKITAYNGATRTATVAWDTAPTGVIIYEICCDIPKEYHPAVSMYAAILSKISDSDDASQVKGQHAELAAQMTEGLVPRTSQQSREVHYSSDAGYDY